MLAKRYKILLLVVTFGFVAWSSYADDAQNKSVATTGTAKVLTPISLMNTDSQGLSFGSIVIGTTESKIVVSASETISPNVSSGNAVILTNLPQTAAKFTVVGEIGSTYIITIPSSITISFGANPLTVDNLTCSNGTGGTISVDEVFYIGGELTVPSSALPGYYHGTFNVTVAYN